MGDSNVPIRLGYLSYLTSSSIKNHIELTVLVEILRKKAFFGGKCAGFIVFPDWLRLVFLFTHSFPIPYRLGWDSERGF